MLCWWHYQDNQKCKGSVSSISESQRPQWKNGFKIKRKEDQTNSIDRAAYLGTDNEDIKLIDRFCLLASNISSKGTSS